MGTVSTNHIIAIPIAIFVCIILLPVIVMSVIWMQEKHKVKTIPKVPFDICEIHGMYPASQTLHTTVPGLESQKDLILNYCPRCYAKKFNEAKNAR